MKCHRITIFLAVIVLTGRALLAQSQVAPTDGGPPRFDSSALNAGQSTLNVKPQILNNVGIDQKLDAQLPLDTPFTDESGRAVKLGDFFGQRPVMITIVQFSCQNLCTLELNGLCRALNSCALQPGKDYELVTISFDPRESTEAAAGKKRIYQYQVNKDGIAGAWHFLTGSPESIKKITEAIGFRYVYDAAHDQYVHSAALMIATPDGRMSKYLYGAEFEPNDIRLSVADADQSKVGSLSEEFLLYCFHYDPVTGKWTVAVRNLLRAGAVLTLGAVGSFVGIQVLRERRAKPASHE
jgi:protein SCO1